MANVFTFAIQVIPITCMIMPIITETILVITESIRMAYNGSVINDPSIWNISILIVMTFLCSFISHIVKRAVINKLAIIVNDNVIKMAIEQYGKLDFTSKLHRPENKFLEIMKDTQNATRTLIHWGISCTLQFTGTIISCLFIVSRNEQWTFLFVFIGWQLMFYFAIARRMLDNSEYVMTTEETLNKLTNMRTLFYTEFRQGYKTTEEIFDLEEKISKLDYNIDYSYDIKFSIAKMASFVPYVFVVIFTYDDISKFTIMISVVMNLNMAVTSFTSFLSEFIQIRKKIEKYDEFWHGVVYNDTAKQLPIPEILVITSILMPLKKTLKDVESWEEREVTFTLMKDPESKDFEIHLGDRICLTGGNGLGKSCFIRGLTGDLSGVSMKDYEPRNFSSKIVFREQDASSITIGSFTYRQLFDNEPDDKVIDHFMELCGLSKTKYDEKIDPTINGGQKSCLMMATRVHYVVKNEIKFFIMDEPECAMNVETSIPVLKRVFNELSGVTILLITHLRDDEVKQLTTWTTHLHIKRMNETMSMISSI